MEQDGAGHLSSLEDQASIGNSESTVKFPAAK